VEALGAEGAGDGQAHLGAGSDDGDAGHNKSFCERDQGGKENMDRAIRFPIRIGRSGLPFRQRTTETG
ncbi:hypothetical protein ACWEQ2_40480, partial [Streptomyces sp. NPDC004096]